MSIISFQCYELRNTADELDEMAKAYKSEHNVLSPMLRDAADTILELRCKLSGVVDQQDEIERLKAENAKLRELVRDMYGATLFLCGECWISGAFDPAGCDNENCGSRKNYLAMRELRIEADE